MSEKDRATASGPTEGKDISARPTGGVPLSEERLRLLAPQWELISRGLRTMDEVSLGETEPATQFLWRDERS